VRGAEEETEEDEEGPQGAVRLQPAISAQLIVPLDAPGVCCVRSGAGLRWRLWRVSRNRAILVYVWPNQSLGTLIDIPATPTPHRTPPSRAHIVVRWPRSGAP
jgi:hypothetical protein